MHPLQPDATAQGALELLWRLEQALCEITGMARATLQPPAGACGELTGLLMMRAYHAERGGGRTKVIIPDSAHGTNPASVHLAGFQAVPVPSDARGLVDVSVLEKLVDDEVAGLMLTNPNTLGLFEQDIEEIARIVTASAGSSTTTAPTSTRSSGGAGRATWASTSSTSTRTRPSRPRTAGEAPAPVRWAWWRNSCPTCRPRAWSATRRRARSGSGRRPAASIGRMHGFHGNFGVLVRAYAYVFLHGADGLQAVSEHAVLNANYLASLIGETTRRLPGRARCTSSWPPPSASRTRPGSGRWTSRSA